MMTNFLGETVVLLNKSIDTTVQLNMPGVKKQTTNKINKTKMLPSLLGNLDTVTDPFGLTSYCHKSAVVSTYLWALCKLLTLVKCWWLDVHPTCSKREPVTCTTSSNQLVVAD